MKYVLIPLALLLFPLQVLGQAAEPYEGPIIDMHLHAYPLGYLGPAGVPNFLTGVPSPATEEADRDPSVRRILSRETFNAALDAIDAADPIWP